MIKRLVIAVAAMIWSVSAAYADSTVPALPIATNLVGAQIV